MKLHHLAHARAGDKGDISCISVIAYKPEDFPTLQRELTAEKVKAHFQGIVHGNVERYELPNIHALNFVLHGALGGGVTRSLAMDAHGKSLSYAMLDIEIPT